MKSNPNLGSSNIKIGGFERALWVKDTHCPSATIPYRGKKSFLFKPYLQLSSSASLEF